MLDLLTSYEEAVHEAACSRNLMLRLLDQQQGADAIAEFIAVVASQARGVALPGYTRNWVPAHEDRPDWARCLDENLVEESGHFRLPPSACTLPSLRGFWRHGVFRAAVAGGTGLRPVYRPGLPVIEVALADFDSFRVAQHAWPGVAFSADLFRRRQRFFAAAVSFVGARLAQGSDSLYLLYQDPAWLCVMGSEETLEHALRMLQIQFMASVSCR